MVAVRALEGKGVRDFFFFLVGGAYMYEAALEIMGKLILLRLSFIYLKEIIFLENYENVCIRTILC
jgi:hypothetical protein